MFMSLHDTHLCTCIIYVEDIRKRNLKRVEKKPLFGELYVLKSVQSEEPEVLSNKHLQSYSVN